MKISSGQGSGHPRTRISKYVKRMNHVGGGVYKR